MIHFRNGPKQLQLENSRCAMGLTFQDQEGEKNNHKTKKNNNKTHTHYHQEEISNGRDLPA